MASLVLGATPTFAQAASSPANAQSTAQQREATIRVLPQVSRVCVGQTIDAQYVERLPDGTEVKLQPSEVRQFPLSDEESATLRRDGSWQTSVDPMRSVLTGFRLSVALTRDSSVRGEAIVAPAYDCLHIEVRLAPSDRLTPTKAYVRLGTFATPFYDSVVVAVVELESRPVSILVLSPSQMRAGAIKISAPGKEGARGRNGRQGAPGSDCSNGDPGEDGDEGEPGQAGGQVDVITQEGSQWLADLVTVSNPGGRGGAGGAAGAGGGVGVVSRAGSSGGRASTCGARPGRSGRPGKSGSNGSAGPLPKVTSVLVPLLWTGSPIWSNASGRRAIEGLLAYEQKRK